MPTGEHFRKLTPEQALEIRSSSEQTKILAERFAIGSRNVRRIRQGMRWKIFNR